MIEGMRHHLLLYERLGFSVIPITPQDKRPALNGDSWTPYQSRRASPDEVAAWWPDSSNNNIGVVTGAISNLIVLDFDDEPAYDRVIEFMPELNDTLTCQTGRGYHVYLHPQEPAGKTFTLKWGESGPHHVKSDGGYVVAPPSIHPNGSVYTFGPVEELLELPLEYLVAGLQKAGFERAKPEPKERPADWYEELFSRSFGPGERNTNAASLMGMLRHYIPHRPSLALGLVKAWSVAHCAPPMPDLEIENMLRSFYSYPD